MISGRPRRYKYQRPHLQISPIVVSLALAGTAIVVAAPYYFMVSGSLKPNSEIYAIPIRILPSSLDLTNYAQLFGQSQYLRWFVNSGIVTIGRVALSLLLCSMAGYALAKFEFRGKRLVFGLVLLTMLLPIEVLLLPLFQLMVVFHWINNYLGVIIPFAANSYGVFLMRQFMLGVPSELLDAARIDGASEFRVFWRIALPLARSGLVVLGIILFTDAWNDFLWPLVVLSDNSMFTLPLGVATLNGPYEVHFGTVMAGAALSTVPIVVVFLFLQRQFIAGLTSGAIKR